MERLYVVPNSQITTVSNLSRDFAVGTLNISVDAREDPDRVMAVLKQVAADVRADQAFKDIVIDDPQDTRRGQDQWLRSAVPD